MWWVLGFVLGTLEVLGVTWLVMESIDGNVWAIAGYVAYCIYCLTVGGDLFKLVMITLLAIGLIFATAYLGLIWAAVLYVIFIIVGEFFPRRDEA